MHDFLEVCLWVVQNFSPNSRVFGHHIIKTSPGRIQDWPLPLTFPKIHHFLFSLLDLQLPKKCLLENLRSTENYSVTVESILIDVILQRQSVRDQKEGISCYQMKLQIPVHGFRQRKEILLDVLHRQQGLEMKRPSSCLRNLINRLEMWIIEN